MNESNKKLISEVCWERFVNVEILLLVFQSNLLALIDARSCIQYTKSQQTMPPQNSWWNPQDSSRLCASINLQYSSYTLTSTIFYPSLYGWLTKINIIFTPVRHAKCPLKGISTHIQLQTQEHIPGRLSFSLFQKNHFYSSDFLMLFSSCLIAQPSTRHQ